MLNTTFYKANGVHKYWEGIKSCPLAAHFLTSFHCLKFT